MGFVWPMLNIITLFVRICLIVFSTWPYSLQSGCRRASVMLVAMLLQPRSWLGASSWGARRCLH